MEMYKNRFALVSFLTLLVIKTYLMFQRCNINLEGKRLVTDICNQRSNEMIVTLSVYIRTFVYSVYEKYLLLFA